MNKLLKTIAPVVLVLYVSVFACPAWGEETFPITVNAPESVEVGKTFNVEIAFSKQAIANKELYLNIEFSKELNVSPISTLITQESYRYTVQAPTTEGTCNINLNVTSKEGATYAHKAIQVKAYKAVDLNPVVAIGVVTLAVLLGGVSFLANLIAPGIAGMH